MDISIFSDIISIAIALDFAYIFVDKVTNTEFYKLISYGYDKFVTYSITLHSKETGPIAVTQDEYKYINNATIIEIIENFFTKIKQDLLIDVEDSRNKTKKYISTVHHSHMCLLLSLCGLMHLFSAHLKISNINDAMLLSNTCCITGMIFIIISELNSQKWSFIHTFIVAFICFSSFTTIVLTGYKFGMNPTAYSISYYFAIISPFFAFIVYFLKGITVVVYQVIMLKIRLKAHNTKEKASTIKELIDSNRSTNIAPIDTRKITIQ